MPFFDEIRPEKSPAVETLDHFGKKREKEVSFLHVIHVKNRDTSREIAHFQTN